MDFRQMRHQAKTVWLGEVPHSLSSAISAVGIIALLLFAQVRAWLPRSSVVSLKWETRDRQCAARLNRRQRHGGVTPKGQLQPFAEVGKPGPQTVTRCVHTEPGIDHFGAAFGTLQYDANINTPALF